MVDERLDVFHRPLLGRRRGQSMVRLVRSGRHVLYALPDNAQTLANLLDAHQGAVEHIAVLRRRHIEFELVVAAVGPLLAQVPVAPRGSERRPRYAPVKPLGCGIGADADGAALQDLVLQRHLFVVIETFRHVVDEVEDHPVPTFGQVLGDAADPEPARMHASARDRLDDGKETFPVREHVQNR